MSRSAFAVHIAICLIAGWAASRFTPVHWLAAAFWCSAALYLNGSLAYVEDSQPGGFDNPDGREKPLAGSYAIKSLSIVAALVAVGFTFQLWLGNTAG